MYREKFNIERAKTLQEVRKAIDNLEDYNNRENLWRFK